MNSTRGVRISSVLLISSLIIIPGCGETIQQRRYDDHVLNNNPPQDIRIGIYSVAATSSKHTPRIPTFETTQRAWESSAELWDCALHGNSSPCGGYYVLSYPFLILTPLTLLAVPWDFLAIPFRWDRRADLIIDGTVIGAHEEPEGGKKVVAKLGHRANFQLKGYGHGGLKYIKDYAAATDAKGNFSIPMSVKFDGTSDFFVDFVADNAVRQSIVLGVQKDGTYSWGNWRGGFPIEDPTRNIPIEPQTSRDSSTAVPTKEQDQPPGDWRQDTR